MVILETIVEEANSLGQQIKRHVLYPFTGQQKEEFNPDNPPVLLIHGYFISHVHMEGLQDFLTSQGFNAICEQHGYWRDLDTIESQIASDIKENYSKTGKQISLIGYSAGGVIARSLAQKDPELIDKVIALGAPHQGTLSALPVSFLRGMRQMLPGGEYIREIEQLPIPENVDFYSIYSDHDWAIIPSQNATIPSNRDNVTNLLVEGVSHIGLVGEKVYPLIADILNRK